MTNPTPFPGEFTLWLAFFICIVLACLWPDKE